MSIRVALVQLNSGDFPQENLPVTENLISRAADEGATFIATPEVTNIVSSSRSRQLEVLQTEEQDLTLKAVKAIAKKRSVWILIGSLALKSNDPGGRFVNRSFLISPSGRVVARYDKIHMFDVVVSEVEKYCESAGYKPGKSAVIAKTEFGDIGMTICYDIRFPSLYRTLAQGGALFITVPSAFSQVTGEAHWHTLLRARAIECGSFVLAPAQTGLHAAKQGRARTTYGHSLIVDPWGEVLCDAGTETGIVIAEIDPNNVNEVRRQIPSLRYDQVIRKMSNADGNQ